MAEGHENHELEGLKKEVFVLLGRNEDLERDLSSMKSDMETRMRILESANMDEIRGELHGIESRVRLMEMAGNERKQNFNTFLNFVVQLLWVCMAAYLLTKLGLQGPL